MTSDRRLGEVLSVECFQVDFCGVRIEGRRIDKFGRFQVPCRMLRAIPETAALSISIPSPDLIVVRREEGGSAN